MKHFRDGFKTNNQIWRYIGMDTKEIHFNQFQINLINIMISTVLLQSESYMSLETYALHNDTFKKTVNRLLYLFLLLQAYHLIDAKRTLT